MPEQRAASPPVPLSLPGRRLDDPRPALPRLLQETARAAGAGPDPFVGDQVVAVEAVYDLSIAARGEAVAERASLPGDRLLALEATDGTTLFLRADRLREELERLYPEATGADGTLDLAVLRDRDARSRGLPDWVWSRLSVLTLGRDATLDAARDKAREWVLERLGEAARDRLEALCGFSASTLAARALMWAIESRLAGEPGLYRWDGGPLTASDRRARGDPRLAAAAQAGPLLVFIHGTGSHTAGSFGDLRAPGAAAEWAAIARRFGDRVFGFEHRTFSESPIDNAIALAETLPKGASLALVTHSRGGLVGDLLCLGGLEEALVLEYRHPAGVGRGSSPEQRALDEAVAVEEQGKLRRLRDVLAEKDLRIERYVRVACPARGTRLLSDNLEVFLGGLLSLMSSVVGAVAGPAGSPVLSAFKRVVLEIADKRLDPRLVPGIEAMLTDAPLGRLLARAPRKQGVEMAVIAGDVEGAGLLRRLGVLFTDWMFFDRADNDLVVDTDSMYAGLAHTPGARYLFERGPAVNHFSYFGNRRTRAALGEWLTAGAPAAIASFSPLEEAREPGAAQARERARQRAAARGVPGPDTRPVVVILPGIMGSHLERRGDDQAPGSGDRVWLDPLELMRGGLREIRYGAPRVHEEALFEMFYGDLAEHLERTHTVLRFPYDWRLPVQASADRLAERVRAALREHPSQPVRLLAHSMGGLVARAMIARHPELWQALVARGGGRLLMLGTPNNGSHLMVAALLGKADAMRKLARLDVAHGLQEVLDIVAGFPGALQLLPRPGFQDAGGSQAGDYFRRALWEGYRGQSRDRWFGDGVVGVPSEEALGLARELWEGVLLEPGEDGGAWRHRPILPVDRVAYVSGQADNTPCGVKLECGRLKMVGTPLGDGSVTWASGRLDFLPDERWWHMPVDHGSLVDTEEYFPAIDELLEAGETARLGRPPVARGVVLARTYDADPTPYPSEEELVRSLLGSRPRARKARGARQRLAVRVRAMDLRHAELPVMCGHYIGDPIAGAEAQIDRHLVAGALRQRERLGVYAGEIGTATVVLTAHGAPQTARGAGSGAVVVGLGEMGKLSAGAITEAVRSGVLAFLLHAADRDPALGRAPAGADLPELALASPLIGHNSTAHISVEDSVDAVVLGVCEANRQFEEATGARLRIGRLDLIELFLDTAITAAHAVRDLPRRLERPLTRLEAEIDAADRLVRGEGARARLSVGGGFGYWPRVVVTAAEGEDAARLEPGTGPLRGLPPRLRYVFLSARARAEVVVQQRQPGLVERLVQQAIGHDRYNPDLARTLFQLMVPVDFKALAREVERLVLLVDGYTANLPWEMLQAEDQPLVLKTAAVRQLVSSRFRRRVASTTRRSACVIVDPSTEGFREHFGKPTDAPLPALAGAVEEGRVVREVLEAEHYEVVLAPSGSDATEVLARLFRCPYRILVIAAHGVFQATASDGATRTGVVLSDGVILTAAEVSQMEVVPEVVLLNCCHLGQLDPTPVAPNRLAYSLARELIEMGVRCVVAAGWAVNDEAACTFAHTLFDGLVRRVLPFGEAVHAARRATYERHPGCNTWGAYQAYGDPGFVLERRDEEERGAWGPPVAVEELVAEIERLRVEARYGPARDFAAATREARERLRAAPPEWADLPGVQAALGALFGEYGEAGFEAARTAYLRAIAGEDPAGHVPVRAIEQLASLEAHAGERFGGGAGMQLVEQAIARVRGLLAIAEPGLPAAPPPVAAGSRQPGNRERWSLLGSALKRKALLQARAGQGWAAVRETLREARRAWASAAGLPADPGFDPCGLLERLQLDALLEPGADRPALAALAAQCEAAARGRLARTHGPGDAVTVAHARLTVHLLAGTLAGGEAALVRDYEEALGPAPRTDRELDPVVGPLGFLGAILDLQGRAAEAETVHRVAASLYPAGGAAGRVSTAGQGALAAAAGTPGAEGSPRTPPGETSRARRPPRRRRATKPE